MKFALLFTINSMEEDKLVITSYIESLEYLISFRLQFDLSISSSFAMVDEQQQAQYYDKLLNHMNKAFKMNIRSQELYLDLKKHTRTIKFKSIKNIYTTLTDGKADEVIYEKDKAHLITSHTFNQKFTQRTCWRIVEKLVTKISYYLSNQQVLGILAPSIIKMLSLLRNASDKTNNRASFVAFFEEVVDTIIVENNLLEGKIYDLLIKRGYIYSIDEFYRLNRFQDPQGDYICPQDESKENERISSIQDEENRATNVVKSSATSNFMLSKNSRSRFGGFSSKNAYMSRSKTFEQDEENIPEEDQIKRQQQIQSHDIIEQQEIKPEEFNRLSHQIHNQVEKAVQQIFNNQDLQSYISSHVSEEQLGSECDSISKPVKPSLMKHLLKNLKNRNFKANQKILVIDDSDIQKPKDSERKNSVQKLKKRQNGNISPFHKNRPSIALALNKGMKERIFRNEHLADIQDLIIDNLDRLQNNVDSQTRRVLNKKNILFRSPNRQHTQNFPIHNDEKYALKPMRRASNFQLLHQFGFNSKTTKNGHDIMRRMSNFGPQCNMSEVSSNFTISTNSIKGKPSNQRYRTSNGPRMKNSRFSTECNELKRFVSEAKENSRQKRFYNHNKFKTDQFNTALLKITAQKYNKCVTEQPEKFNQQIQFPGNALNTFKNIEYQSRKSMTSLKSAEIFGFITKSVIRYEHPKKYEIYDPKRRRIL